MAAAPSSRDRFFYDVRQYALIQNTESEILILQLPEHCGAVANQWTLPGGKLEPADTPESGLLREIEEETGLEVSALKLIDARRWGTENSEKLGLFYSTTTAKTDLLLSSEHKAAKWIAVKDIDTLHFYRQEVADVLKAFLT